MTHRTPMEVLADPGADLAYRRAAWQQIGKELFGVLTQAVGSCPAPNNPECPCPACDQVRREYGGPDPQTTPLNPA